MNLLKTLIFSSNNDVFSGYVMRFRVLCGHTRELWHKTAGLI